MATQERIIIENLFRVADKDGNDVDFKLNSAQASIDSRFTGRDIIPKARQEGVSTYYLARFAAKCLYKRNTRAVVISHDTSSTQRMLNKVHYFLENIKGPKAVINNSSKNEITFAKTNSVFYIGTAGSRRFGRGDTITDLHCSEYAYWPNPKELITGLFQAVPKSGEIGIESTGNGVGNDYHKRCMRAAEGNSRFRLHFLDWLSFDEYKYDISEDMKAAVMGALVEEWEEPQLVKDFGATAGQLLWRRDKLEELDYDLTRFKQEYPSTLDECFQSSGHSIFGKVNYEQTDKWKRLDQHVYALEDHPRIGYTYVIGADPSGGVGLDNATMQVVCLDTYEQVAEFASDKTEPDVFAHKIAFMGNKYNKAFLSVESNNHGIVTLKILSNIYPRYLIHRAFKSARGSSSDESLMALGVSSNTRSKPLIIGNLRTELADTLKIHSPLLKDELSTFIETETGKLEAEEGCKDDRVIALAMAIVGLSKAAIMCGDKNKAQIEVIDPFSLDSIIDEMTKGKNSFPISPQHAGAYNV